MIFQLYANISAPVTPQPALGGLLPEAGTQQLGKVVHSLLEGWHTGSRHWLTLEL